MMTRPIWYLACPYTHEDATVREERYQIATKIAAALIEREYVIFSPITMTHPIDKLISGGESTLGSKYWVDFDTSFMQASNALILIPLPNWEASSGVNREIEYFRSQNKPCYVIGADNQIKFLEK